jgi:hypothetical protein
MVRDFKNGSFRFEGVGKIPRGRTASSKEANKGITGG